MLAGRGSREFLAGLPVDAESLDVQALGFVADLGDLYRHARVVAAPLSEGGGIKIKILEAMARGVPVVTTPVGAEGIADADGGALMIAPADEGFAAVLSEVAGDRERLRQLSRRGRELIERDFSWSTIVGILTGIYGEGG